MVHSWDLPLKWVRGNASVTSSDLLVVTDQIPEYFGCFNSIHVLPYPPRQVFVYLEAGLTQVCRLTFPRHAISKCMSQTAGTSMSRQSSCLL